MAITLSTGATIAIAKNYLPALGSAATATTALSNASECVVTATHSLDPGDYVVMASGGVYWINVLHGLNQYLPLFHLFLKALIRLIRLNTQQLQV
jgi:hypothetical protein